MGFCMQTMSMIFCYLTRTFGSALKIISVIDGDNSL